MWCLIRANYKERFVQVSTGKGYTEVKLIAGSFIFGRESAAKSLHMSPSTVWKRILKLKKLEILNIESNSHYSIVYIINWHSYQDAPKNGNSDSDSQGTAREHRQSLNHLRKKKTSADFSQISFLEERYSDRDLINQCFKAVSSTRKPNRILDSVKLSILQSWDKYPVNQVMDGIRIYLEKSYAEQGKNEKYLLGIIRGNSKQISPAKKNTGKIMKRTGSMLDQYYQEQGYTLT